MTRKDYFGFCFLLAGVIAGYFIGSFKGGVITGSCTTAFILAIIGKRVAKKAMNRIDKNVKDIIVANTLLENINPENEINN